MLLSRAPRAQDELRLRYKPRVLLLGQGDLILPSEYVADSRRVLRRFIHFVVVVVTAGMRKSGF